MKKIGITGNIASGKSQVEKIFTELGFKVIDCDEINSRLLFRDDVKAEVRSAFGTGVFCGNVIAKVKLAEIVFNSEEKRKLLEEILHKRILKEVDKFIEQNAEEEIVFVSAALLFEADWAEYFDKIILVSADREIRLKRLQERNGYSVEEAQKRIDAQINEQEKILKSNFVIFNNTDLSDLKQQTEKVLKGILDN